MNWATPKANDVVVGEGIINFPGVIKELRDQKFKGLIYVECEHKMDNNVPDVITSLKYFNDITKKAE
jgi:sugar phosphate isomerase/epimerase